jgi:hypothetical protein
LELLINDPQLKIRVESYLYLLERNSNISELEITTALENISSMGDASLLIAACIFFRDNQELKRELGLEDKLAKLAQHFLIDHSESTDIALKFHILKAIAFGRFIRLHNYIDLYLESGLEGHRRIALEACSFTLTKSYAYKLINALQDPVFEKTAADALRFYGETLLIIGDEILQGKDLKNSAKAKFVRTFSDLGSQNVVNYLTELLDHESFKVRKEALVQLNIMKTKYGNLDFQKDQIYKRINKEVKLIREVLSNYFTLRYFFLDGPQLEKDLFLKSKKKVLRRIYLIQRKRFVSIFLLLGLEYDKKDIFDIYSGLMSKDELKRSYSLEFMEMFVDYKYGKLLSPLLESIVLKKPSMEELEKIGVKLTTVELAINSMVRYPDEKLQIAFLDLFEHEEMKEYKHILSAPIKIKNPLLATRLESLRQEKNAEVS